MLATGEIMIEDAHKFPIRPSGDIQIKESS